MTTQQHQPPTEPDPRFWDWPESGFGRLLLALVIFGFSVVILTPIWFIFAILIGSSCGSFANQPCDTAATRAIMLWLIITGASFPLSLVPIYMRGAQWAFAPLVVGSTSAIWITILWSLAWW